MSIAYSATILPVQNQQMPQKQPLSGWMSAGCCGLRGDHSHVLGIEREAEHVEILRDTLRMHRLGNADHTALNQPAQHHLRHRLFVPGSDRQQDFVREQPVLALVFGMIQQMNASLSLAMQ